MQIPLQLACWFSKWFRRDLLLYLDLQYILIWEGCRKDMKPGLGLSVITINNGFPNRANVQMDVYEMCQMETTIQYYQPTWNITTISWIEMDIQFLLKFTAPCPTPPQIRWALDLLWPFTQRTLDSLLSNCCKDTFPSAAYCFYRLNVMRTGVFNNKSQGPLVNTNLLRVPGMALRRGAGVPWHREKLVYNQESYSPPQPEHFILHFGFISIVIKISITSFNPISSYMFILHLYSVCVWDVWRG